MFKYLDYLRKKPDIYKKTFAVMTSFFVVGVMFVIWLSVIYPDIKNVGQKKAKIEENNPTAISAFMANVFEGFSSIGESFGELTNSMDDINNLLETTYYNSSTTIENFVDQGLYYDEIISTSTEEVASSSNSDAGLEPNFE